MAKGEIGMQQMGLQARLMSQALHKMSGNASKAGCTLIFLNQIRYKIGVYYGNPEVTSGGIVLKFFASLRLEICQIGKIKSAKGDEDIGVRVRVRVKKSKVSRPYKQAEFEIIFGEGVSKLGYVLDCAETMGIVLKKGSWYSYGEHSHLSDTLLLEIMYLATFSPDSASTIHSGTSTLPTYASSFIYLVHTRSLKSNLQLSSSAVDSVCGDPKSVLPFAFIEFTDEEGVRATLGLSGTMLGFYPVRVVSSKTAIAPVNPTFLPRANAILSISYDIALGKDTEHFYIVVMCLLLLSFIGSFTNFLMFSYTSFVILLALPVLYENYEVSVDRYLMLVLVKMHLYKRIYEECFNRAMEWIVEKMKEC